MRAAALALLLAVLTEVGAQAQAVSTISGTTMTLTFGQKQGVTVGMTGRTCADEEVGGRKVEVCVAKFTITAVRETTATATITGGDPGEVASGHRVVFDQKLTLAAVGPGVARSPAPPAEPPVPDDPLLLVEAADSALKAQRFDRAAELYERLLRLRPGDPWAAKQLSRARDGSARPAEVERQRQAAEAQRAKNAQELAYLGQGLTRATNAGDTATAAEYARQSLALDPGNAEAEAIRAGERRTALAASDAASSRGDLAAVEATQTAYTRAWPGDAEFAAPAQAARQRLEASRREEVEVRARREPAGTWRDTRTTLLWTLRDNGDDISWRDAQVYCESLSLGGFGDWRLPAIEDLETLYDASSLSEWKVRRPIVLTANWVWSSDIKGATSAWGVNFFTGNRYGRWKAVPVANRALCVRSVD